MKKVGLLVLVNIICLVSLSQKEATIKSVKVTDWSQITMTMVDEVWNNARAEIVSQIGEAQYDSVRKHYDYRSIPTEMSLFDGHKRRNLNELNKDLGRFKSVYQVATFKNYFQGKFWGDYAILMVPYKGNEEWNPAVKWDVVYFIIPTKYVEQL